MPPESSHDTPAPRPEANLVTRREAVRRVTAMLGGIALVGSDALLAGCLPDRPAETPEAARFTADDIAFLDEIAETILPETSTPGAKAAETGAFIALMVTDTYYPDDQRAFRAGMLQLNEECRRMHGAGFMEATPEQRLALLTRLDQEQAAYMRAREEARWRRDQQPAATDTLQADTSEAAAHLPDQRQENTTGSDDANPAPAITADAPAHYFRMMKELALLGYFTSEIGYTQHMRYVETPGRFDPCVPHAPGEKAWAPHA